MALDVQQRDDPCIGLGLSALGREIRALDPLFDQLFDSVEIGVACNLDDIDVLNRYVEDRNVVPSQTLASLWPYGQPTGMS